MISNSEYYIVCITLHMFLCFSSVILSCSQFLVFPWSIFPYHFLSLSLFLSCSLSFTLFHFLPFLSLPLFFFYSTFFVLLSHLMCLLAALYNDTYIQHFVLPASAKSSAHTFDQYLNVLCLLVITVLIRLLVQNPDPDTVHSSVAIFSRTRL